MKRRRKAPEVPALGSKVRLRFGVEDVVAVVIEHCGPLGIGGREMIRVRFQFEGADEPIEIEMPVDEVTVVDPAA